MKEAQFRNKVTWFTFFFSVLVIWVHSNNSELFLGGTTFEQAVFAVEDFIGRGVAQIAVPGFFIMSAYLFFRGFTWNEMERKWVSRIKSVLVPYIVWNSLYYAGYLAASRIPVMTDVVGRGSVPFSLDILAQAILHHIYNPVFWYLYQLILLILLAPILYAVLKNMYMGIAFLLILLFAISQNGGLPQINLDALFYYSAGGFAALHLKEKVEGRGDQGVYRLGWALLLAAAVFFTRQMRYASAFDTVMYRFLAPAGLWFIVDSKRLPTVKEWMTYNFFLYATHFALVRLVNKAGAMMLPVIPASPLMLYMFMPVAAVLLNYRAVKLLKRYSPTVWGLLNGGRG